MIDLLVGIKGSRGEEGRCSRSVESLGSERWGLRDGEEGTLEVLPDGYSVEVSIDVR